MLDIPSGVVGGEGGGAKWTVGVALSGEMGCDGAPSHVEACSVHCHGGSRVKVGLDRLKERVP